jgi:hypothetical protein
MSSIVLFLDHYQYYIVAGGTVIGFVYCMYEKYIKKEKQ